ncbi:pullulanase [Bifidobacterium cuniculi]|uniref:Alpha-amylase n=3 Tax=Bifidobacterium cuniculi TaxID=1688 RepID=A0A087B4B1_9BIFI|nr:pullulanase [Bifidobacterium cuniculi]
MTRYRSYKRTHAYAKGTTCKRSCAALAILAIAVSPAMAGCGAQETGSTELPKKTDVEVIAFQQPWNSIAKECTETYGPEGVAYVEVSPPQETIEGTQWWTSYQPVSYKLDSKLGTQAEFKNMVEECNTAGVDIIADVVLNQTTGANDKGTQRGVAGTKYNPTTGDYPGFTGNEDQYPKGITKDDFHDYENGASITGYLNQEEVQEGRLSGMWDFDTSSDKVQDIQSDYFAKLYEMGVRGFRIDAAKHIDADDLKAIKEKTATKIGAPAKDIFWVQEVIGNAGEASGIQPSNYFDNGTVTQFAYVTNLKSAFKGSLTSLSDLGERLGDTKRNKFAIPDELANVFVTNWDTARNGQALTYRDGADYALANAFMLAYDYGTPRLISDYGFTASDDGAPGSTATEVPEVDFADECSSADGQWNCQQRWTPIRGMIAFHNYVHGTQVTDWQEHDDNVIAFSRGNKGFIAINNSTDDLKGLEFDTDMPDGEYCDVYGTQDCSTTVTVKGGKVKVDVAAKSAVAIYAGATAKVHPASSVAVDPSTPSW